MIGLLSNENLPRGINWASLSDPLYAAMERETKCLRVAPPGFRPRSAGAYLRAAGRAFRCNALFSMHGSARNEWPLVALSALRGPGAVRAAFFVDPWPYTLHNIDKVCRLMRIRLAFIPYRETCEQLRAMGNGVTRYIYLPFAADTEVFRDTGAGRDIDILSMGRRCEPLHEAILAYSQANGLNYQYRETMGFISDPDELGRLVARSRYFVTTPPDLFSTARTGGISPLVMRYFEGLAAGCRLLGVLPGSGEFEALVPRGSLLEVSPDGSDFAARFAADQNDAAAWQVTRETTAIVREKHGWDARAKDIVGAIAGFDG